MEINIPKLREIGWSRWNPIGLPGPPETPADEYDSYLLTTVKAIKRRDVASQLEMRQ